MKIGLVALPNSRKSKVLTSKGVAVIYVIRILEHTLRLILKKQKPVITGL